MQTTCRRLSGGSGIGSECGTEADKTKKMYKLGFVVEKEHINLEISGIDNGHVLITMHGENLIELNTSDIEAIIRHLQHQLHLHYIGDAG